VTSAISVAPIEDPQILVYVVEYDPKRGASGSAVAGPVVQNLMSLALARYAVPQSTTTAPKLPIQP
jgi:cell division protein FtsI (penicillin-binding protein 3)